jgi:hypothetical protein
MFRVVLLTAILGTLIGGGYLVYNYRLHTQVGDDGKVSGVRLARRSDGQGFDVQLPWSGASQPAARPVRPNFRIASYHIPHLDERKLANRR